VTFRAALLLNDLLSLNRNAGVREDRRLPAGRVLDAAATASLFPTVDREGLKGGGLWYDAVMTSSVRVLMETLRWACHRGATALNYVECVALEREGGRVKGVRAVERLSGDVVQLRAPVVVNCAGPWSRALAGRLDREHERLFRPSLAFNLLLDREPVSQAAVAVTPRRPGARTYFLRPYGKQTLAGTFHAPSDAYRTSPVPTEQHVDRFLGDLAAAVPGLEPSADDVVRIYSGLLPARGRATEDLAVRPVILDHARAGGPSGLWSVSGVKYTTARLVAEHTVRRVFGASGRSLGVRPGSDRPAPATGLLPWGDASALGAGGSEVARETLARLVEEEAVLCMEDLLFRRTDWAADPRRFDSVARTVTRLLGWELPSRVAPLAVGARSDA
jgi:glycerol-3-phosphate dehydrogenase